MSRHFFIQSELKAIVTRSRMFSRASRQVHAITSNLDWLTGMSVSAAIG